jgi:hypothetical protein
MKLASRDYCYIGASCCIIVLAYSFFYKIAPLNEQINSYKEYNEKLSFEFSKLSLARKRVELAKKTLVDLSNEWQEIVEKMTPVTSVRNGGIDLSVNRWQLTVDARRYRDALQLRLNQQMRSTGVHIVRGPEVAFPPLTAGEIVESYFNYPAIPFPIAIFNLGTVEVEGTLEQINGHVTAWNQFKNCIALTHNLTIKGTAPRLTASYHLSLLSYVRGNKIGALVPEDPNLAKQEASRVRGAQ